MKRPEHFNVPVATINGKRWITPEGEHTWKQGYKTCVEAWDPAGKSQNIFIRLHTGRILGTWPQPRSVIEAARRQIMEAIAA